jgi:hypothetical protein
VVAGFVPLEGDTPTAIDRGGGITVGERGAASTCFAADFGEGMVCRAIASRFVSRLPMEKQDRWLGRGGCGRLALGLEERVGWGQSSTALDDGCSFGSTHRDLVGGLSPSMAAAVFGFWWFCTGLGSILRPAQAIVGLSLAGTAVVGVVRGILGTGSGSSFGTQGVESGALRSPAEHGAISLEGRRVDLVGGLEFGPGPHVSRSFRTAGYPAFGAPALGSGPFFKERSRVAAVIPMILRSSPRDQFWI